MTKLRKTETSANSSTEQWIWSCHFKIWLLALFKVLFLPNWRTNDLYTITMVNSALFFCVCPNLTTMKCKFICLCALGQVLFWFLLSPNGDSKHITWLKLFLDLPFWPNTSNCIIGYSYFLIFLIFLKCQNCYILQVLH